MKTVLFSVLLGAICSCYGCNPFKSDHPQTEIASPYATDLNAKNISSYADSIDQMLSGLDKQSSLVYLLGDLSFYVEKFSRGQEIVLLVEHAFNGGNSKSLKKYYFKGDSLILMKASSELANEEAMVFKDIKTYLRSNTVFKVENRTASSLASLNALPFIDVQLSNTEISDHSLLSDVKALNDVIEGKDKFDMVFENITTYPDSRYILLKSKIQNSYMASVLVQNKDAFIDSLLNNPIHFKNQKLHLKWTVQDHEAVYVPQ